MEAFNDKHVLFGALTTLELRRFFRRLGEELSDFICSEEFYDIIRDYLKTQNMTATDEAIW